MNNKQLRVIISQGDENKIMFAAVDESYKEPTIDAGIHFFPTFDELRVFKFGKNNIIILNEIPNKDCEKCFGTGTLGKNVHTPNEKLIYESLLQLMPDKELAKNLVEALGLPLDFIKPMSLLLNMAEKELTEDNHEEVARKYAEIIKEDFVFREIVWCDCFIKNLQKAVDDIIRLKKFSIN